MKRQASSFTRKLKRCAEEHGLPLIGRLHGLEHSFQIGYEAHIEKAVCLINNEDVYVPEAELARLVEVQQPARGADDDIRPLLELPLLKVVPNPSVNARDLKVKVSAQELCVRLHLESELPGGDDNQRPLALVIQEILEDGDEKCCGLARTRL